MTPTMRPTFDVHSRKTSHKIALEEAIGTRIFDSAATFPPSNRTAELPYVNTNYAADVHDQLTNIEARVKAMDEAGVALTVVSLTMPGIEGIFDTALAIEIARKVNDEIHELYTAGPHSHRFRAFGCVAMQDPQAAAAEAERCIKELGFVGILINGFANIGGPDSVQYLDEPQCAPFWEKMAQLDVPLYLHPRVSSPSQMRAFKGYEFLGRSPWGFGTETATHAIRLMVSGLFDRLPNLRVILGHCGEGVPFSLNRVDHRLRHCQSHHTPCQQPLQYYWDRNFYVTTSGIKHDNTFFSTLKCCGEDRVMWSVDYPYEHYNEMATWFDELDLNSNSRAKIGWENARRILKLD